MSAPATVYIIKVGGNVIDNPAFLDGFLKDFAAVPALKVLIHGGVLKKAEAYGVIADHLLVALRVTPNHERRQDRRAGG